MKKILSVVLGVLLAFAVVPTQAVTSSEGSFKAWTKVLENGSQVKFYAKYPQVGDKIQFMRQDTDGKYKQVAWLRLTEADVDPEGNYLNLQNEIYFIRTLDLKPGKNRVQILVNGKVVWGTKTYIPSDQLTVNQILNKLTVATETRTGYDRGLFEHWVDEDSDGCDTRREVLIQEAEAKPTVGTGCEIIGGSWLSSYDGVTTTNPSTFDIDHLVPLAEAWDSGAINWNAATRKSFANDTGFTQSLIAVTASSNRSKSDQDPSEWMPEAVGYKCTYLASWVSVKYRWSLSVDSTEKSTIASLAGNCKNKVALPAMATVQMGEGSGGGDETGLDPKFDSCTAARAAGYGPYYREDDEEYAWYRDGDGDGIVCE